MVNGPATREFDRPLSGIPDRAKVSLEPAKLPGMTASASFSFTPLRR
jgi:hypothetical protein